jgi:hypothetical protein
MVIDKVISRKALVIKSLHTSLHQSEDISPLIRGD